MEALPVVEDLDVLEQLAVDLGQVGGNPVTEELKLDGRERGLSDGVDAPMFCQAAVRYGAPASRIADA